MIYSLLFVHKKQILFILKIEHLLTDYGAYGGFSMGLLGKIKDSVTEYKIVRTWAIVLILILLVIGTAVTWFTYSNTLSELVNIEEQINPSVIEPGYTAADYTVPATAEKVTTGIYIDRIKSISLKDNLWTVDFFIWFKWTGDANPGQFFQVVDGSIDKNELIKNTTNGNENFALYKVTATITKQFDMFRFPEDNQLLTIDIQDKQLPRQNLVYVPDNTSSSVGPDVSVSGYAIDGLMVTEKPFLYNSTMGDSMANSTTFSQFRSGILLSRNDLTVFFISLIGIFVAVFAAILSLTISSFQGRFSMEGSSMFVGITSMLVITNIAPTGVITVGHLVNAMGLFIISLSLFESAMSLHYFKKGEEELSRRMDLVSIVVLSIGFVSIVTALALASW